MPKSFTVTVPLSQDDIDTLDGMLDNIIAIATHGGTSTYPAADYQSVRNQIAKQGSHLTGRLELGNDMWDFVLETISDERGNFDAGDQEYAEMLNALDDLERAIRSARKN